MKLNFCTLFNSGYLSRGLVMYESLKANCSSFHLYVFAFDDACYDYLKSQELAHLTVISLREFEDPQLLSVKKERTAAEYCWTSTASTILYSIQKFGLDHCTYIDADMRFYADPKVLIEEMGSDSVLITEHRYSPAYKAFEESGKYCVQFVSFKNDERGMKVLKDWRAACIEWCYARIEDGKFGDQKYLDQWTGSYEGVHELQHLGGGLAPWNIQQYTFQQHGDKITGTEISSGRSFDAVFYHYHALKFFSDDVVSLTDGAYKITEEVKEIFYKPYIRELNDARSRISAKAVNIDPHGARGASPVKPLNFVTLLRFYLYDLRTYGDLTGKRLKERKAHYHYYSNL